MPSFNHGNIQNFASTQPGKIFIDSEVFFFIFSPVFFLKIGEEYLKLA